MYEGSTPSVGAMVPLDVIVIGTGPSFYEWLKTPVPEGVKLYGCGVVSRYLDLDVYAIGDICHLPNMPNNHSSHCEHCGHSRKNTIVYGTIGMLVYDDRMLYYDWHLYPHGGSSGGMAVSLACLHYERIGVIGLDGPTGMLEIDMQVIKDTIDVFQYWKDKGKKIYSLMPHSVYNEVLLKECQDDMMC